MRHPDYPFVSSMTDRLGKIRWRFRKTGRKPVLLPGEPHTPAFDAAYKATVAGRSIRKKAEAEVVQHPRAAVPETLNACWMKVKSRPKFQKLDPTTRYQYTYQIEEFLAEPMRNGLTRGQGPVADLRPRHIQDALDKLSPSKSVVLKVVLKKLMKEARLQDWIEFDPTYGTEAVEKDPDAGFKAWPSHICAKFERHWKIGSMPRTIYELARWLGSRRSDIALLRWDQMVTKIIDGEPVEGFEFVQFKGRRKAGAFPKFHPLTPMLADALAPLDRTTETIVVNTFGKPYRMQSLSQMMWSHWCPEAGIPRGYTLHGLRKAMGGLLVDADASLHESRDFLGHATYKEVANYNRSRDQAKAAIGASRKIVKLVRG